MMTKEKRLLTLRASICFVLMSTVLLIIMASTLEAETINLRFASYHPPRGLEAEAQQWMMGEITKRTNGKVRFEQYFGESLLKSRELLKGIQAGTANMGYIFVPYFPRELEILTLPQPFIRGPGDPLKSAAFFQEFFEQIPEVDAKIGSWNQKRIATHIFGKMGVGGIVPIKTLADVKGLKVRCAGGYDAQYMKCLGANVVFLKAPELYSAMQKRAVDATYIPPTSQYRSKLHETGNPYYLLVIPSFTGTIALITMNLDTWKSLPSEVQQVVSQVGKEYTKFESAKILELERESIDKMAAYGSIISEVSKEEINRWADMCEEGAKARWVKEAEDHGLPGKKLMERISQLIRKYSD